MICLDTNYLILGLSKGSNESKKLIQWFQNGDLLVTPMPVWYEFLCGPVNQSQIEVMRSFISEIIPFGEKQAVLAADLFNVAGRKRSLRVDAMIAATAMIADAKLATNNREDFSRFKGLKLK